MNAVDMKEKHVAANVLKTYCFLMMMTNSAHILKTKPVIFYIFLIAEHSHEQSKTSTQLVHY